MLAPFRFIPAARLDDLMVSWASDGGGVGPHTDSYDVFLLQVQGRRRWRVAPPEGAGEPELIAGLPLKILRRFRPVHDWVLEPGDMLYLPPGWGHDGVALGGDCMTCSIGFRAPGATELARELLLRLADGCDERGALYVDRGQAATSSPAALQPALVRFAERALAQALRGPRWLPRALGEVLTEPKPRVWFDAGVPLPEGAAVRLDARTRMLHDGPLVFINGESVRCRGRDGPLLRKLADERALRGREVARLSGDALRCLRQWAEAGWLRAEGAGATLAAGQDDAPRLR
jgi:50S ribosomal protein L16 3-hydroxylase